MFFEAPGGHLKSDPESWAIVFPAGEGYHISVGNSAPESVNIQSWVPLQGTDQGIRREGWNETEEVSGDLIPAGRGHGAAEGSQSGVSDSRINKDSGIR